jgi:hypothetical protein
MTTNLRRSMWSAICAAICAMLLGASTIAFAPAASAHGGLTCTVNPPSPGGSSGYADGFCEVHGVATMTGRCGDRVVASSVAFNHQGGTIFVDRAMAGTTGPIYNVTLSTSPLPRAPVQ